MTKLITVVILALFAVLGVNSATMYKADMKDIDDARFKLEALEVNFQDSAAGSADESAGDSALELEVNFQEDSAAGSADESAGDSAFEVNFQEDSAASDAGDDSAFDEVAFEAKYANDGYADKDAKEIALEALEMKDVVFDY